MWQTGNRQSSREFDAYYTWALRARLWVIVTAGGCAVVFVLLYGLGPLPATVRVPIWLGVFVGLPVTASSWWALQQTR